MRKLVLVLAGVLLLTATVYALVPFPPSPAKSLTAEEYRPLGTAHIAGWDWLRATDARVEWTFDTTGWRGRNVHSVYLNFAGLATNGEDGGSGYEATVRLWVSVPGGPNGYSTVQADNPFRPQSPVNSGGLGYAVYGHGGVLGNALVQRALEAGELKVMATWTVDTVSPPGRHYAVNRAAVTLGYLSTPPVG